MITSFGTVTGLLAGVSVWPRRRASLWNDLDGRRVEVTFAEHHDEDVRWAWGERHVEITGMVHENSAGQMLRVNLERLDVHTPSGLT